MTDAGAAAEHRSCLAFVRETARQTLALFPAGTFLLASAATLATLLPFLGRILIDAREAADRLEPWRPWTGHLVHGTLAHLALNLAAFVPLGLLRERRRGTAGFLLECAAIAACVAAGIRLFHPSWTTYCGLSGVVYGLLALVLLEGPTSRGARTVCWSAVAVLAVKSVSEYRGGGWLVEGAALEGLLGVVFLPASHVAGLVAGVQDISHELRSPLARLNIAIELARTADDRDAAAQRLQKEVDRLTGLVGALLEVTRVEGDPSTRRSEEVRVGEILRDVVQSCSLEAEARQCRLVVRDDSERRVNGDPELMRRALENVVRNAIRYAPVDSDVELQTEDRASGVVVSVRDTGKGVPDALLPRLTQPFFRVEDARDASSGGIGLGLSIAHRAVRLHHGTLVAENAHPGLRVTLTFPDPAVDAA